MSASAPGGSSSDATREPEFDSLRGSSPPSSPARLYRSRQDRLLGGVCGGLGQYFGIDPVIVRLAFVLLLTTGIGVLAYLVLWIVVPERPADEAEAFAPSHWGTHNSHEVLAWVLVFFGLVLLLGNLQLLRWIDWSLAWPILLIAIGAALLARQSTTR